MAEIVDAGSSKILQTVEMQETLDQIRKDLRLRVWKAIIYEESTKPDWEKLLSDMCICCAVSPPHDRDVWDTDGEDEDGNKTHVAGELKKSHRHIVMKFSGSKSFTQVWDILREIALDREHCPPPKKPGDIEKEVQYLIHLNNKDKARYLRSGIISINGFDVDRYFRLNSEQEEMLFDALMQYIINENILEYWPLLNRMRILSKKEEIYEEIFRYCRTHTILITAMLKSRRFTQRDEAKITVELEGELVK